MCSWYAMPLCVHRMQKTRPTRLKPRLLHEMELQPGSRSFAGAADLCEDPVVWMWQRKETCDESPEFDSWLANDEKVRRDRLRRRPDRQRFAAGRAWLRVLLGEYLGLQPHQIVLQYGIHGKPCVEPGLQTPAVHFNVAQSGDVVLLAFHRSCEVGVDVEQLTENQDWDSTARLAFSSAQYATWAASGTAERQPAFFQHWTRREAGLKALGCGFAVEQPEDWDSALTFIDLELPAGYAGSVAILESSRISG